MKSELRAALQGVEREIREAARGVTNRAVRRRVDDWRGLLMRRATCGRQLLRNCCEDRFDPQTNRGYRFEGEASFGSALAGKCSWSVVRVRGYAKGADAENVAFVGIAA